MYTKNKKRISKDISKDSDSQTKIVQRSIKSQMRETMHPRRESRIFRHIMAFFSLLHRDLICDPLPSPDNSSLPEIVHLHVVYNLIAIISLLPGVKLWLRLVEFRRFFSLHSVDTLFVTLHLVYITRCHSFLSIISSYPRRRDLGCAKRGLNHVLLMFESRGIRAGICLNVHIRKLSLAVGAFFVSYDWDLRFVGMVIGATNLSFFFCTR